jgi:hypothetical protein
VAKKDLGRVWESVESPSLNAGAIVRWATAAETRSARLVSSALVGALTWFWAIEAASSCASSCVRLPSGDRRSSSSNSRPRPSASGGR